MERFCGGITVLMIDAPMHREHMLVQLINDQASQPCIWALEQHAQELDGRPFMRKMTLNIVDSRHGQKLPNWKGLCLGISLDAEFLLGI
jgi:hypothetical protein